MCLRELIPGRAPPAPLEPEGTEAIFSPLSRVISIARTLRSTAIESVTRVPDDGRRLRALWQSTPGGLPLQVRVPASFIDLRLDPQGALPLTPLERPEGCPPDIPRQAPILTGPCTSPRHHRKRSARAGVWTKGAGDWLPCSSERLRLGVAGLSWLGLPLSVACTGSEMRGSRFPGHSSSLGGSCSLSPGATQLAQHPCSAGT